MPATHKIDAEEKIIVTCWEGGATDTEIIEAADRYKQDYLLNPHFVDYNEIVDFTNVESIKVTPAGLKKVSTTVHAADDLRSSNRVAIVVNSSLAFYLAKTYVLLRNAMQTSKEVRIFKEFSSAFSWLCEKDAAAVAEAL